MHIAILAPHLRNAGGIKILFNYANMLVSRGHVVTLYVRSTNPFRRLVANMFQLGLPSWISVNFKVLRVPVFNQEYIAPQDCIIAGGFKEALALADISPKFGKGFYLVQHDEGLYHGDRDLVDKALRSSLVKIAVSSWLVDMIKERTKQDAHLLLNPYDRIQFFGSSQKKTNGSMRILVLDHTYAWKGTDEAISIVRSLQQKYPEIILVGLGRRREEVEGIYDEYFFDPPQEKLREIYGSADIFLCTSWDEGFGLPSLEAMACGTAVVTYDNGGSRDFAHDGVTAFVAPHRDKDALMKKLEQSVINVSLRCSVAIQGKNFVEKMPMWEQQVVALEKILYEK